MKYKPQDYAKAFAEVAASAPKEKESAIAANFVSLVKKNGDIRHINKIVELAEKLMMKHYGRRMFTVESARPLKDARHILKNIVKPHDALEENINPELVAGARITMDGERQFDGSLKAKLDKLFINE